MSQQDRGESLSLSAQQWLANGRRGISSETMFTRLTGMNCLGRLYPCHPHDPDDFDRCVALLHQVPELRERLPMMASESVEWAALVEHWGEIERSHLDEVGLGWTKAGRAPKTYALMRRIIDAAREVKP